MLSKGLTVGIIVLFIASAIIPMTLGYNTEPTELDKKLENLAFVCREPNGFNSVKYEHYKQQLIEQYPNENNYNADMIQLKNNVVQGKPKMTLSSLGPMDSPWPMSCHDTHHTCQSPYSTAGNTGLEKWRFKSVYGVDAGITIANDGSLYFGSRDWYLYCLYPNGTLKWKFHTGNLIWSSPAIAGDGTIYVGSWDCKLYAINPNGTLKWRFNAADVISSSPAIGEDGTIYFGVMGSGDYGRIQAVNSNGTEKWHYDTGYWIVSNPAIGNDGTVYIGSGDTYLYAMNPNGTLKWRFKTGDVVKAHPSIAQDGTIYIGSFDEYIYALNPDGTLKWERSGGSGGCSSAAIDNNGNIYYGEDTLKAVYPNGTLKWSFNLGYLRYIGHSSPAISADGTIYVGVDIGDDGGGELLAVNPDGTEKWRKQIARFHVDSSPSIAEDGTVYIGSSTDACGCLHAFGTPEDNDPPSAPTITGPANGNSGEKYTYTLVSTDPENYPVKYFVNWGDGTNSGWTWEYDSGEEVELSHTWSEQGTYLVKAKTMDISNAESDWGTLSVTMPVNLQISQNNNLQINQQYSNQFFLRMFQRVILNIR